MNRTCNVEFYKSRLSSFGCDVLDDMLRRKEERDRNMQSYSTNNISVRERRVITFGDFETNVESNNNLVLRNSNQISHSLENDIPLTFGNNPVMKHTEHMASPNGSRMSDNLSGEILSNEDQINKAAKLLKQFDADRDEEQQSHYNEDITIFPKTKNPDPVKWDDIFDSEMFKSPTVLPLEKSDKIDSAQEQLDVMIISNQFTAHKLNPEKMNTTKEQSDVKVISNHKLTTDLLKQARKRKCKPKVNVKNTTAKNKKVEDVLIQQEGPVPNFSKEKYATIVKKWLGDIQPHEASPSEERQLESPFGEINHNNITKATTVTKTTIKKASKDKVKNMVPCSTKATLTVEKVLKDKDKKTVQAQLANKDGVMKFRNPNSPDNEIEKCDKNDSKNEETVTKNKKAKAKFVVPFKSQTTVADDNITYNIAEVNDENIKDLFCHKPDKEGILLVIIYENGFCQLNRQYSEDSCVAEGLLINFNDSFFYVKHDALVNKTVVGELLTSLMKDVEVILYEGKHVLIYLADRYQVSAEDSQLIDVKIGCCLLEPDDPPADFAAARRALSGAGAAGAGAAGAGAAGVAGAGGCALQRAAGCSTQLRRAATRLRQLLLDDCLWELFTDLEMKVLPIIADMERVGVQTSLERLRGMEAALQAELRAAEAACHGAAGRRFAVLSAPQVRALLYDELRLDAGRRVRGTAATGAKSTAEATLRGLVGLHPLPALVLQYRHLHKGLATFLSGVAQHVRDGVVRPTWEQMAASTGRISSNNPNLQAIPKAPFSLNLFPAEGEEARSLQFRSLYAARRGRVLLAADWRLLEVRVFAHAARDARLLRALAAGPDLFRTLAAQWLGREQAAVSAADRERTKRIVYASLYGAGARTLADLLDEPPASARRVADSFNKTFPSLRAFGRRVAAACAAAGAVRTPRGGARRLPRAASADPELRAQAERQAVNFVIQGSAADLCKEAMVSTARALRAAGARAQLLLQIHDELLWEVDEEQLPLAARVVRRCMEAAGAACGLPAALPVRLSAGPHWAALQPYALD